MTTMICPMLSALKPVDDAGVPVDRECIYEQCRFFNLEKRDCTLMMASRAMLRMSEEPRPAPPAEAAHAPADFERRLTEMGKDLMNSSLEVQGVVREAGQAAIARVAVVDEKLAAADAALERRLQETESRLQTAVKERLDEMAQSLSGALGHRLAGIEQNSAGALEALRVSVEEQSRAVTERFNEQAGLMASASEALTQIGAQVAALTDLQQKVGDRLLEELSLVSASFQKLGQGIETVENKTERSVQENLHLVQLLTLVKGETERTYAALRSINEGNRSVIQAIETQLQRDQADLRRKRQDQAQSCNNRGVLAYYRGALDAAHDAFRQAVKLQPDDAEAYNNLGLVLSKLGRDKEAVEAFQEALKLDPKMGEVYNNLGFLYHTSSQFDRAVEMFGQAIQNAADSSVAYTNLGNTFYKMKQPEKAVEAWRHALELDPMNENAHRGLRMFQQEPSRN